MFEAIHFAADFQSLERLLQRYQQLDASKRPVHLKIQVEQLPNTLRPGYPSPRRNALLTLEYLVELIQRAHASGQSAVSCEVHL